MDDNTPGSGSWKGPSPGGKVTQSTCCYRASYMSIAKEMDKTTQGEAA